MHSNSSSLKINKYPYIKPNKYAPLSPINNLLKKLNKYNIIKKTIHIYNTMRPHFSCNLMTPQQAHLKGKFNYKKWGNFSITEIWN